MNKYSTGYDDWEKPLELATTNLSIKLHESHLKFKKHLSPPVAFIRMKNSYT